MSQIKILKFKVSFVLPDNNEKTTVTIKSKETYEEFVNEVKSNCSEFFTDNPKKKLKFIIEVPKDDINSFYDSSSYEDVLNAYKEETKAIKIKLEEKKAKKQTLEKSQTFRESIKLKDKELIKEETKKEVSKVKEKDKEKEKAKDKEKDKEKEKVKEPVKKKTKEQTPSQVVVSLSAYLSNILQNQINKLQNEFQLKVTSDILNIKQQQYENRSVQDVYHDNILCQKCLSTNIKGIRYLCAECDNYNICDKCEKQRTHNHPIDHLFLKITKPINAYINGEYSCMFPENNLLLNFMILPKLKNLYKLKLKIINTGTKEDWNDFILCPIGYGKDFIGGNKLVIHHTVPKATCIDVEIEIFAERKGTYVTKWRMFTKEGIPFGDVFKCPVKVDSF